MQRKKKIVRRKKAALGSRGLSPKETAAPAGAAAHDLAAAVEADGGAVIGHFKDPFGVRDLLLATLQRAFHAQCAGPCPGRPAPDGVDLDRHHLRAGD